MKLINELKNELRDFRKNFISDFIAGFLVFLLALPLSIGIAQASDFQPIYGLITAAIGGCIVAFFSGSPLSIKGPAAGLIVLVASSVADFGGGQIGWKLTLGVIIASGFLQVIFGLIRFGSLTEFFPFSVVKGMLAAIGLIILSKQLHSVLGFNPVDDHNKPIIEPIELFLELPKAIQNMNFKAFLVGLVALVILFTWPLIIPQKLKRVPGPVMMLLVIIPFSFLIGLNDLKDEKGLPLYYINFNQGLFDVLTINVNFDGFKQGILFIKHTLIFAIIGSLESLLTVNAIDLMVNKKDKSQPNRDLIAIGVGNIASGFVGGLPIISEVARSSANISYGAKTRWSNFFHGLVMLMFLVYAVKFSSLIPKPALAAILISVGVRLANPSQLMLVLKIGKEQLLAFVVTIIFTLTFDLLVGILIGTISKILILFINGLTFKSLFKSYVQITRVNNLYTITIEESVHFLNFMKIKKEMSAIEIKNNVIIDIGKAKLIDSTVMQNLKNFSEIYIKSGGECTIIGTDNHVAFSNHIYSSLKQKKK
jgi:MFS superfamily sulfate permease-like transporter